MQKVVLSHDMRKQKNCFKIYSYPKWLKKVRSNVYLINYGMAIRNVFILFIEKN